MNILISFFSGLKYQQRKWKFISTKLLVELSIEYSMGCPMSQYNIKFNENFTTIVLKKSIIRRIYVESIEIYTCYRYIQYTYNV